jgi:hypothetical protein
MNAARKSLLGLFLCPLMALGQAIVGAEYFIDADPGVGNGFAFAVSPGDSTTTVFSAPLGALPTGMHLIAIGMHLDTGAIPWPSRSMPTPSTSPIRQRRGSRQRSTSLMPTRA